MTPQKQFLHLHLGTHPPESPGKNTWQAQVSEEPTHGAFLYLTGQSMCHCHLYSLPCPEVLLFKLTMDNDMDAFLATFERVAQCEPWAQIEWSKANAPLLTGEAQCTYYAIRGGANGWFHLLRQEPRMVWSLPSTSCLSVPLQELLTLTRTLCTAAYIILH